MRLCVLGTGYVGLVAGAGFADFGNEVVCVDIDAEKVARLHRGELPIYEPGLERLVAHNVAEKRLSFSTAVAEGVSRAEVVLIAVGTPQGEDGSADLQYVLAAAAEIGRSLTGFTVIVNKSTVPVGSADKVREVVAQYAQHPFAVVSNPEFLKEGDAVADFMKPDRVIIGVGNGSVSERDEDRRAREVMRNLYAPFVRTNDRILLMDTRSAELTKYASNAFLATRISFMNEMANLCEGVGADVEMVRRGIGMDQRIGPKFLFPGIGYGGSCFPKDVQAVLATARDSGGKLEIVEAVHRVNQLQKERLFDKLARHFGGVLQRKKIALWGLSFKPGTDDIREAPALVIIDRLVNAGAEVHVHDPVANGVMQKELARHALFAQVVFHEHNYDALAGAHALVLCTEWHQFRRPNFQRVKELLAEPVLFDGRNIWDPAEVRALGFTYYGIGRR